MTRTFRLLESCFTTVFFIQALRLVVGILLNTTSLIVTRSGAFPLPLIVAFSVLAAAILAPSLAPKKQRALPELLSITAIIVAVARVVMVLPNTTIRLYAGIVIIGFGAIYLASLLRANVQIWAVAVVFSLSLDQLLRAYDTFDYSLQVTLRGYFDIQAGGQTWRILWIAIQAIIALLLIIASRRARANATQDPYRPASLSPLGGMAIGAFFALELIVLAMPNVIARWAGLSLATIAPWLIVATALPLLPSIRTSVARFMMTFDEQLQGIILLIAFVLLTVAGNRFAGILSAGVMVVAQFVAVTLLVTIPEPPKERDQVGFSLTLSLIIFFIVMGVYSYVNSPALSAPLSDALNVVTLVLVASLIGLPRIFVYQLATGKVRRQWSYSGVLPAFIIPIVVGGTMLVVTPTPPEAQPATTFRVATYNMNGGYDAFGNFRLELAAQTIEASLADIVVLQEVDVGRPVSFGADQVEVLARRLDMYSVYQPTVNGVQGVAILSRWRIFEPDGRTFQAGESNAAVVKALIQNPTTAALITVYGTQLQPDVDARRTDQFANVAAFINNTSPAILAGDFQAPPQDPVYEQLLAIGFVDPDAVLQVEQGFTTPAINPVVRYDYILLRGLQPIDSRQVESSASDHRLVVVEVRWP